MSIRIKWTAFALCGALVMGGAFQPLGEARAQSRCDSFWTGAWDTTYGQLRLIEDGTRVYGDYGSLGTIKGRLNKVCGDWLRGTFERKDGSWGYIEFVESGDDGNRFTGYWSYSSQVEPFPSFKTKQGTRWRGTRKVDSAPPILNFKPGESRDPLDTIPTRHHSWARLDDIKAEMDERERRRQQEQEERERREEEARRERERAEAAKWARFRPLSMPYRDIGAIVHHSRFPFLTSPREFRGHINRDKNFTGRISGGSGELVSGTWRMATSLGDVYDERWQSRLPADVLMGVYRHRDSSGSRRSYCVVSYRGTDQDVKYFGDNNLLGRAKVDDQFGIVGEGGIATNMRSADLDPTGATCTVKQGYMRNYEETKGRVLDFLKDATNDNHCQSGILVTGMSLGGATASVAVTDLAINQVRSLPRGNLRTLLESEKLFLVTAGAPRALSQQCVNRLPRYVSRNTERFVYGSTVMEDALNKRGGNCPRFIDPVPGNPSSMRAGSASIAARHFGTPVVGFVPKSGAFDPRSFVQRLADKPVRTAASNPELAACVADAKNRCLSAVWANDLSRVAGQGVQIDGISDTNFGGSCAGVELQPTRKYLFGRLHDTCSYRNLMASYGRSKGQFRSATNFQCNFPPNPDDPVGDKPKSFTTRGYDITQRQYGPR